MIYFIECAGRIKIGYTKDVADRIKGLSTGSAHDLRLLCSFEGSVDFERAIHRRLKTRRLRGEWFEDCTEVRELMDLLRSHGPSAIGFSEPPERPKYDLPSVDASGDSPLKPIYRRMESCTERYLGEAIAESLKQEAALGLPKGTLANRRSGGFYTTERAKVAFIMGDATVKEMDALLEILRDTIFDGSNSLTVADLVPAAIRSVEKYERGMQRLFAVQNPAVLDLSGFAN
jgi:hypothetical protein